MPRAQVIVNPTRTSQYWVAGGVGGVGGSRQRRCSSTISRALIQDIIRTRKAHKDKSGDPTTTVTTTATAAVASTYARRNPSIYVSEPRDNFRIQQQQQDGILDKNLLSCVANFNNDSSSSCVTNLPKLTRESSQLGITDYRLLNTRRCTADKAGLNVTKQLNAPVADIRYNACYTTNTVQEKPLYTQSSLRVRQADVNSTSGSLAPASAILKEIFADETNSKPTNPSIEVTTCAEGVSLAVGDLESTTRLKTRIDGDLLKPPAHIASSTSTSNHPVRRGYKFPKREFLKANSLPAFSANTISQANRRRSMNNQYNSVPENQTIQGAAQQQPHRNQHNGAGSGGGGGGAEEDRNKCAKVQLFLKLRNCKLPNI